MEIGLRRIAQGALNVRKLLTLHGPLFYFHGRGTGIDPFAQTILPDSSQRLFRRKHWKIRAKQDMIHPQFSQIPYQGFFFWRILIENRNGAQIHIPNYGPQSRRPWDSMIGIARSRERWRKACARITWVAGCLNTICKKLNSSLMSQPLESRSTGTPNLPACSRKNLGLRSFKGFPREGAGVVTYIQPHLILRGVIGLVALARKGLVVEHDAAATASHILTHQTLFRLGVASSLASTGFYLTLVALFYEFFRPVNRSNSLLAAFFGLLGCAIQAGGSVFQVFSLVVLRTGQGGPLFNPEQLPALALLLTKLNDQAVLVALVFFAMYDLLIGYLILRSTFLPRFLGALMVFAGLGWLTFLYEPLADHLSPYIQVLGIIAEVLLMLWLLVMSVNAERWREQAATGQLAGV